MKKLYLTLLALFTWMVMSVASFAIDVIVVSHGQANDPFWSVAKNGVDSACQVSTKDQGSWNRHGQCNASGMHNLC